LLATVAGGVYRPLESIVPAVAYQLTAEFELPLP
jgi:hypothetical protein